MLNLVTFKMDLWHMPCLPSPRTGTAYEFHFINHHLHKTNSVLGYFIQDHKKYSRPGVVVFGGEEEEEAQKNPESHSIFFLLREV